MIVGLLSSSRGSDKVPPFLDYLAIFGLSIGMFVSLYDFGGLNSINQVLELGVAAGFCLGTYLLSKNNSNGFYAYILMNCSNCALMFQQDYMVMGIQQILSLMFVLDAAFSKKLATKKKVIPTKLTLIKN